MNYSGHTDYKSVQRKHQQNRLTIHLRLVLIALVLQITPSPYPQRVTTAGLTKVAMPE